MIMSILLIGGGAYLLSSLINKSMAKGTQLFGKYPMNSAAIGGGVLALLLAPMAGPLAPIIGFLGAAAALGGTASVLKQQGVKLLPSVKIGGDLDYDNELEFVA